MGHRAAEAVAGRRADGPASRRGGGAGGGGHVVAAAGDDELAAALVDGRPDALAELYDRYAGVAYGVALRILGDPARAEDAVQDAFLNVWRRAATFDAARGSVRAWLLASVRNRCIDHLRGRGGHERAEESLDVERAYAGASPASDPWREVALSLERAAVRDAMAVLPPEQRQALELGYFGGYSHHEIAEMTRVPLGTIKGRMRLGLEKVASYLRGRGLFDE